MTMLTVHVAKMKFLNPLHSFTNTIDIVFEVIIIIRFVNLAHCNRSADKIT